MRLCKQTKEWFCRRTIPNPGDTVWRHGIHNPFRSLALKICCGTGWWLAAVTCTVGFRCKRFEVWLLVLCCYHLLSSPTVHWIDNGGHVQLWVLWKVMTIQEMERRWKEQVFPITFGARWYKQFDFHGSMAFLPRWALGISLAQLTNCVLGTEMDNALLKAGRRCR